VFTVLQDDMPVGGMTYRLSTDTKQGLAAETKAKKSAKAANRKTAVVRSRSRKTR
jgi:hypothetical protein